MAVAELDRAEQERRLTERRLNLYIDHIERLGFRPKKVVREVTDKLGVVHQHVTVYFQRVGGLPGPIPTGADFRPYPLGPFLV